MVGKYQPHAGGVVRRGRLRVLHNLARSGGTLINRLLLTQARAAILSEVHPDGFATLDALAQAHHWFGLLEADDMAELAARNAVPYAEAIALIARKAAKARRPLILRDWSHLDFMPFGMGIAPSMTSRQVAVLSPGFDLLRVASVRHPLDHWLSLAAMLTAEGRPPGRAELEQFLDGALGFARLAVETGFVRYEAIIADPVAGMADLCDRLQIGFNAGALAGWAGRIDVSTGAIPGRAGLAVEIETLPRRPAPPHLMHFLSRDQRYGEITGLLGYD